MLITKDMANPTLFSQAPIQNKVFGISKIYNIK